MLGVHISRLTNLSLIPAVLTLSYFSEFICKNGFKKLVTITNTKKIITKNLRPRRFLFWLKLPISPMNSPSPITIQYPIESEK
jgi:hypothetical protein